MLSKIHTFLYAACSICSIEILELINTASIYENFVVKSFEFIIMLFAIYRILKGEKSRANKNFEEPNP